MKKFTLGIFFDHTLESGGNFQQSLNNIFLAKKLESTEINIKIFTTEKDNKNILQKYGLDCILYTPNVFSRLFMRFRESSSVFIYKLINLFFRKNHFENFLKNEQVDLIYFITSSHFANYVNSVNYIFTLFDLCHRDNPEFPEVRISRIFEYRENLFQKNLSRSVAVLVDSELGKKNTIFRYRLDEGRVHIFPIGPAHNIEKIKFNENNEKITKQMDIKKKYDLKNDYLFYPAQFWAHKNHIYILKALKILKSKKNIILNVIFAGSDQGNLSYIKDMTKKFNLENQVRFVGFVSSEEINFLYSQALALVMPTYFGPTNMPPLEAFKLKVPVLYSNINGLREQVEDAALLFDLNDPNSLVENLEKLISSNELRNDLVNKGQAKYNQIISHNNRNNYDVLKNIIENFKSRRECWK
jgi:glycosyltransferase involved in cell wall biosynthesis